MEIIHEKRDSSVSCFLSDTVAPTVHLHKEFEVIHVVEGTAVAYVGKNNYSLKEGDTLIVFPNQIHYYKCRQRGKFLIVIFSPERLSGIDRSICTCIPDTNCIPGEKGKELSDVFCKIMGAPDTYRDLILGGYINVLLGLMLPLLSLKTAGGEDNPALYNIMNFCSENFREDITLEILSEKLHLSKYYISHLINQNLKQNFNEYVSGLRISEACLLLRETDLKITDISENVGFGTLRSFNRVFKRMIGLSPARYRQENLLLVKAI